MIRSGPPGSPQLNLLTEAIRAHDADLRASPLNAIVGGSLAITSVGGRGLSEQA
ncbi:MAG: hypothetical protein ABIQ18_33170 [Umezawaea sp.]